ncbi:hypothetical protein X769_20625 [Mesorhizobium sp. LSJC268A00]|nr:hypothetical protein X771_08095 [Mesorhizobium sp. LSJC277A00]ESW84455.1 hypothetical protein X770_24025 [Mesorhizobium sp. LSJC269B00]ESX01682.1 hypothetical protein X769_20625 [Mesorhizobium sp. LSJC268A00]ESX09436.1 hypothetical protein X768_18780 [Mesorhizobium sp. LSJC265A00]ESX51738.1 hypothetical protein X761_23555 [Mesorhizobium sp. LSHC424B00]ESX69909.1 hypothetical protein X758_18225 [Mesorhizobium sp. LSHC416B00]ESX94692.1 hypothetical protein X755_23950 [Mesorhizobium sp. LNJC4
MNATRFSHFMKNTDRKCQPFLPQTEENGRLQRVAVCRIDPCTTSVVRPFVARCRGSCTVEEASCDLLVGRAIAAVEMLL